jgi:hypothetical protein
MFSWLSNEVRQFPGSRGLAANIQTKNDGKRPLIILEPTDHPLSRAQRYGIRYQDALTILHQQDDPITPAGPDTE